MLFYFFLILPFLNASAEQINDIIIENTAINSEDTVKTIKRKSNQSSAEAIENNTHSFVRKSGGTGSNLYFHIDNSTSTQINFSIEGFSYTTPSLASFTPASLYFGAFKSIEINKDNSLNSDVTTAHSANINFKIQEKNILSSYFGSFKTFGISFNDHIKSDNLTIDAGGVSVYSKNDFEFIDFNHRKRIRKNSDFKGNDFYIKIKNNNFKFLNYFMINRKGTPGSAEFERLKAYSSNLLNLTAISYNKNFTYLKTEFKLINNRKNYFYADLNPPIFGLKKITYKLLSNTITNTLQIVNETETNTLGIKFSNMYITANTKSYGNKSHIPVIYENHSYIQIYDFLYLFDDTLTLKGSIRYYLENLYQYSLSAIYFYNENLYFKLLSKKGIRIPYIEEKYFQSSSVVGNKDLSEETIFKNMLSINFSNKKFNISAQLYHSILKNNIIFMPLSFGLIKAVNTSKGSSNGINLELSINFGHIKIKNLMSYSKTKYIKTRKDMPQTPNLSNKLNITAIYKELTFDFLYNYTSKYYNNIFNTEIIPEKHLLSASLKYKFAQKSITFKINNMLNNKTYYDTLHIPLTPRSYFIYFNLYFS